MSGKGTWLGKHHTVRVVEGAGMLEVNGTQGFLQHGDAELLQHFASLLPFGAKIAEIGSFMGLSSLVIARALYYCGNYGAKVFCIDTWEGSMEHRSLQAIKEGQLFDVFKANIEASGLNNFFVPIRGDSPSVAPRFEDASLDMIFIDGDHSTAGCLADLNAWYSKLKPGGIFLGHDCYSEVREAVETFMKDKPLCFTLLGVLPYSSCLYRIEDRYAVLKRRV